MNFKIQVIDISPSLKKLKNEDESIIFNLISPKGTSHIFNMSDIIDSNIPINLKIKNQTDIIKYSIYKDQFLIGEGNFNLFNDTKWLNINPKENNGDDNEKIKIKIKCQIEDYSYTIHNTKVNSYKKYKSSIVKTINKNNLIEKNLGALSPKKNKVRKEKSFKSNIEKKTINQISNNNNRKYSNKLKYNKSCEDENLIPQNFLDEESQSNPLYNSMIYNNKIEINEDNNNNNNSVIKKSHKKTKKGIVKILNTTEKKSSSSRNLNFVNCTIRENNTKISKNIKKNGGTINITDSNIIKKIDDKLKSIEDQIIDKNCEINFDDYDFTKKNNSIGYKSTIENNNISNNNIICNIYNNGENDNSNISFNSYSFDNNDDRKEYIDSEFENLKNDFEIFYTKEYLNDIQEDVLQLEIQLQFEKIFELQSVYHKEYNILQKEFNYLKKIYENIIKKYKMINKTKYKLMSIYDNIQIETNYNDVVNNYQFKNNKGTIDINKTEVNLWKNMIKKFQKEKIIKDIFIKSILIKFNNKNIKNNLNNIEKEICEKLIEKHKINILKNPKIKNQKKEVKNNGKNNQTPKKLLNKNTETNSKKSNNNLNNNNQFNSSFGNSLKSSFQQQQNTKINPIKSFRKNINCK